MDTLRAEGGPTRQSRRERTRTTKALGQENARHGAKATATDLLETSDQRSEEAWDQGESNESDNEDTIRVADMAPGGSRPNRTAMSASSKSQWGTNKIRASTVKGAGRSAAAAADLNPGPSEMMYTAMQTQIKLLTDMVTALLTAIEEQKRAQRDQIEALTKTFTAQINALRSEVATIQAQLSTLQAPPSNVQAPPSGNPSYADVARTPPSSRPSNLITLSSMNTTPSAITDTPYCTVDTSRVQEEDKGEAQPGTIREAIEKEVRTTEGHEDWRCVAVIKDPRNTTRIRITCRDETELQLVKAAAQKTVASGVRVLRDQLYPVKIDNANRTAILNQDGAIRPEATEI